MSESKEESLRKLLSLTHPVKEPDEDAIKALQDALEALSDAGKDAAEKGRRLRANIIGDNSE